MASRHNIRVVHRNPSTHPSRYVRARQGFAGAEVPGEPSAAHKKSAQMGPGLLVFTGLMLAAVVAGTPPGR